MPYRKPKVFIGSAGTSADVASDIQEILSEYTEIVSWKHANWELSKIIIGELEGNLKASDFCIFVFTPDDVLKFNDTTEKHIVRDNVLFETGLAMGMLGRERTFILCPKSKKKSFKLASDLYGLIIGYYDDTTTDPKAGLETCCNKIRKIINKYGSRPHPSERRIDKVIERGDTDYINIMADAALYVGDSRHKYSKELKRRLISHEIVPMKYLYRTESGSNHWLNICKKESYLFYKNSLGVLRSHVPDIVKKIKSALDTKEIDLISIGSGDGEKDNIFLRELTKEMKSPQYVYYYPVDISDTLITEAVKNSIGRGVDKNRIKIKALLADFEKLRDLRRFYEDRPAKNVFSILGNTIGNSDEKEIIDAIANSMFNKDIVIIEYNTSAINLKDPLLRVRDNMLHDFTPLASLGFEFDESLLNYNVISDESIVPKTKTLQAIYKNAKIDGQEVKNIKLSIVHHYDENEFIKKIEDSMNVKTIHSINENGVGIMIAQRIP